MGVRKSLVLLALAASLVSGCDDDQQAAVADATAEESEVSYRQVSGDYVEVVKLAIRDQENVEFRGFLLDPFTDEKLEVGVKGKAEFDEWYWSLPARDDLHEFNFTYEFIENGRVECVLVVLSEKDTPYSGQWSFTGIAQ